VFRHGLKDNELADALAPLDDFETVSPSSPNALYSPLSKAAARFRSAHGARLSNRGELAIDAVVCSPDGAPTRSPACHRSAPIKPASLANASRKCSSLPVRAKILEEVYRQRG